MKSALAILFSIGLIGQIGSIAFGQHTQSFADETADELRRKYEDFASNYKSEVEREVPRLNNEISQLTTQREALATDIDFLNNVVSLRREDDLDRWVAQKQAELDAQYGPRIRIFGGTDDSKWARYYDSNGNLRISEVRNSWNFVQQDRENWNQQYKRASDAAATLNNNYQQVQQVYGQVIAQRAQEYNQSRTPRYVDPTPPIRQSSPPSGGNGGGYPDARRDYLTPEARRYIP